MKDFSVADRRAIEFFKGAMKVDDVISVALFYLHESKEINLIKKARHVKTIPTILLARFRTSTTRYEQFTLLT